MKYEIINTLDTFKVWKVFGNGDAEVVKVFKTRAAAEKWIAKQQ